MSDTQPTAAVSTSRRIPYEKFAAPLLLFSGVLCFLLLVSFFGFLPRFTRFYRDNGVAMSPSAMVQYHKTLSADVARREKERERLVLPISDPLYKALKTKKIETLSLGELRDELQQAAGRLGETHDSIIFQELSVDGHQIVVRGDVRNVGTRSMTVLAALIEEVSRLPFVSDFQRPAFTREGTVQTGLHSPFTMSFTYVSAVPLQ